jgi:hypothetical protein
MFDKTVSGYVLRANQEACDWDEVEACPITVFTQAEQTELEALLATLNVSIFQVAGSKSEEKSRV